MKSTIIFLLQPKEGTPTHEDTHITVKQQKNLEAFSMAEEVKNVYKELRETIEGDFNQIYKQTIRI